MQQYGGWWKLSLEQWHALCDNGARGNGHMLPAGGLLKRRPAAVGKTDYGEGRISYYAKNKTTRFYEPLDWKPEDYIENRDIKC